MLSKFKLLLPAIILAVTVGLILITTSAGYFPYAWITKALLGDGTGGGGHGLLRAFF